MPSALPPVLPALARISTLEDHIADALGRAETHRRQGHLVEAVAAYDEALAIRPEQFDALTNRGVLARRLGRHEEALACYRRALGAGGDPAILWINIANAETALGRLTEARVSIRSALATAPRSAEAWQAAANLLLRENHILAAGTCLARAAFLAPGNAELAVRLASLMAQRAHYDEAEALFAHAQRLGPLTPAAHSGYAQTLISQGRLNEAERHLRRALELDADQLDAHLGVARLLLLRGELGAGWVEYEWRRKKPESRLPSLPGKEWDGSSLEGKRLLVYAEQGFGDVIQFARYVPILAGLGARVTLVVPPQLSRLLSCIDGAAAVTSTLKGVSAHDFHVPLLSVPRFTGIALDKVPARVPYLRAPTTASVPAPLGTRLKVGLAWAGSPKHVNDRNRSLSLEHLLGLSGVHGVAFYSLQAGPRAGDLARTAHPLLIRDLSPHLRDFADTAAAIGQLDLVITVDTAIAHLAGALGKPVWVLMPMAPDWRWLLDRDDTPWYPTMRLYRQTRPTTWDDVVERVRTDLSRLTASRPPFLGPPEIHVDSVFRDEDGRPRFGMTVPRPLFADAGLNYLVTRERSGEGYEYATRSFIDAHLEPGGVFIDAGAHWGIMSLQAATRWPGQVRVLACEPLPLNQAHLDRWIENNGLSSVIEPVRAALAGKPGRGDLLPESTMGHSLVAKEGGAVPVTTIDTLMATRPALATGRVIVKIDVEGTEADVVAGMASLLESGRVAAVIWERGHAYDSEDGRATVEALRQRFASLGFSAWRFDSEADAGPLVPFVEDGTRGNVFELAPDVRPLPSYGLPRPGKPPQPEDPWLENAIRARVLYRQGMEYQSRGRIDEALRAYAGIALLDQTNPDLFNNLGVALRARGRLAAAETAYRRSLGLRPKAAGVLSNLANVLREQGKLAESERLHRRALDLSPNEPRLHYNSGLTLRDDGRPGESRAAFERTMELEPDNVECPWDWALSLLQDGDYQRGLPAYEARWRLDRCPKRFVSLPRWNGEPLNGGSLFLHDEQGFGDVLQWARFIPEAKRRGAGRIVLECQPELLRLMALAPCVDEVIPRGSPPPDCDVFAPLLSLPGLFGVTLDGLPSDVPYLKAPEPAFVLPDDGRRKVGLVWAGKPTPRDRSCPLDRLLPLLGDPALSLFSLQVGPRAADLVAEGADILVTDLGPRLIDFAETAAALAQLDLLVTIDTSVAHLAGALGVPTFLLLLYTSDWRWFDKGETSPWYPSFRLFRQKVPFRWDEPLAELGSALAEFAGGTPSSGAERETGRISRRR